MSTMEFNHVRKDYLSIARDWSLPAWAPIRREYMEIPERPGGEQTQMETEMRRFPLPIIIHAKTFEEKEAFLEDMASWLIHKDPKPLKFTKYPNRTLYAQIEGAPDFSEMLKNGKGTLQIVCPDPYKHGPTQTDPFKNGMLEITNNGTVPVYPIIRAKVLEDITHLQLFDSKRYFQLGEPAPIGSVIRPKEERLLNDALDSLVGWSPSGQEVDGGVISGAMETNGYSFGASSYGEKVEGWHGPSLKITVPQAPITDFKVRTKFIFKNPSSAARGRMEFYLRDDQSQDMAKFAMKRTGGGSYGNSIEARAGGGTDYKYFANYAGKKGIEWRDFEGIMEFSRVGNLWTVYTALVDPVTKAHTARATFTHRDTQNKYVQNLAQIQLHVAQSGDTEPTAMRINHLEVFRINPITLEETNVIAVADDEIEIDFKKEKIRLNGELRPDLKAFGSNFFAIPTGKSLFEIEPSASLQATAEWEEGYL